MNQQPAVDTLADESLIRLLHQRYQDVGDSLARKAAWRLEELLAPSSARSTVTDLTDPLGEIERVRQACYDAGISCDAVMRLARSALSASVPSCNLALEQAAQVCESWFKKLKHYHAIGPDTLNAAALEIRALKDGGSSEGRDA